VEHSPASFRAFEAAIAPVAENSRRFHPEHAVILVMWAGAVVGAVHAFLSIG
jgi:hypothetical protein